jgi:hypothetical protein
MVLNEQNRIGSYQLPNSFQIIGKILERTSYKSDFITRDTAGNKVRFKLECHHLLDITNENTKIHTGMLIAMRLGNTKESLKISQLDFDEFQKVKRVVSFTSNTISNKFVSFSNNDLEISKRYYADNESSPSLILITGGCFFEPSETKLIIDNIEILFNKIKSNE